MFGFRRPELFKQAVYLFYLVKALPKSWQCAVLSKKFPGFLYQIFGCFRGS